MYTKSFLPRAWCAAALLLVLGAFSDAALADDPPGRVARVGYLSGSVSFQPAGDDGWSEASLNRPLGTGDRIYTDRDSRIELQVGAASIRLDERSTSTLLNVDDDIVQVELTEGVLNLSVRSLGNGQSFEVDTPTLAFVVNRPGVYRVDIDPQGNSTMVTVFSGGGDVYGENNASYSVRSGSSYRFNDSALRDYEEFDLPREDDFDRWASSRDNRYERSVSRRYVSEDVIGYSDLDDYGSWSSVPQYGNVWYPTRVETGWAPYRSGHWSWIDPWGWTWVDNNPWGFAPFHYGRWAYVGNRWGWCPGPRHVRAVYAPALVAFVGGGGWGANISIRGGGGPVGWFPLGPRDVYVPWYRTSRNYFTNVNVHNTTIINNTHITNIYNNYSNGRPINRDLAYRGNSAAVTAVSRETFVGARPVAASRVRLNEAQLRSAQVVSRVGAVPTRASIAGTARSRAVPAAATESLNRRVIARSAPPARAISTEARLQAIQRNDGRPLGRAQLNKIASERPAAERGNAAQRVQVVGRGQDARKPQPLPTRAGASQRNQPAPTRGTVQPRTQPATPTRGAPANTGRSTSERAPANREAAPTRRGNDERKTPAANHREAMPSTRFAPQRDRPAVQSGDRATPQSRSTPAPQQRAQPQTRQAPQRETMQRAPQRETQRAPQQRSTPAPQQRSQPQERQAPRRETQRAPQQRSTPAPQQRSQPQPRQAPQRETQRAPQQRSTPAPQPRSQPQPRQAPQREMRQAPQQRSAPAPQQHAQPQQRQAPAPRSAPAPQPRTQPERRSAPERSDDDHEKSRGRDNDRDRR